MTQRYATTDADGRVTGFYADELNPTIPPEAFPIDDETWASWVLNTSTQRWDGKGLVPCEAPPGPPEVPSRRLSPREFRARFSPEEKGALTLRAEQDIKAGDPRLRVFIDELAASQVVELDHPEMAEGMDLLVEKGLLTRERADEILR